MSWTYDGPLIFLFYVDEGQIMFRIVLFVIFLEQSHN